MAVLCTLPVAAASAHARHDQRGRCEVHAVVVRGEISGVAATGATSFTANVWSVRVVGFHPGDDSALCANSAVSKTTGTTTTTSATTNGSSTSTCPVPSSPTTQSANTSGVDKGVAINTSSTTKVMLNGGASTVSALPHGDHFVAVFLVPACAGDGSNSGIPAMFVAAWPPHSDQSADTYLRAILGPSRGGQHDRWHKDRGDKDRWGKDPGDKHHGDKDHGDKDHHGSDPRNKK